jgi:murein DD-endopeptidase MepM/ murein hydrolase activator NlpD
MKHITLIFVPHARAKFRKIRIPLHLLWGSIAVVALAVLASLFLSVNFLYSLQKSVQLKSLRTKNIELKKLADAYQVKLADLEKRLQDLDQKTDTLAVLSGVETRGGGASGGMGGMEVPVPVVSKDEMLLKWQETLSRRVDGLKEAWDQDMARLRITPTITPVKGIPTAGFGNRRDPFGGEREFHAALDISCPSGRPVVATADGMVTEAAYTGGLGKCVSVFHGLGITTRYGHLSKILVKPGDKVKRGTLLGYSGSTGRSTGPHLHYEVLQNGTPVNPLQFILESF